MHYNLQVVDVYEYANTLSTTCDLSNLAYKNFNVFNITFEKWTEGLHLVPEELQTFTLLTSACLQI